MGGRIGEKGAVAGEVTSIDTLEKDACNLHRQNHVTKATRLLAMDWALESLSDLLS